MSNDEQAIRTLYDQFSDAVPARDIDRLMSFYVADDNLFAFDAFPPRHYVGAAAYRKAYEAFFAAFPGPIKSEGHQDAHITTAGNFAFAYGSDRWVATAEDGQSMEIVLRYTDVLRKIDGKWLIVHEDLSVPVDPVTGAADFLSQP